MCHATENSLPLAPGGPGPAVLGLCVHCFGSEVGGPLSVTGEGPKGSKRETIPSTQCVWLLLPPQHFPSEFSANHGYTSLLRRRLRGGDSPVTVPGAPGTSSAQGEDKEVERGKARGPGHTAEKGRPGLVTGGTWGGGGSPASCTTFRPLPPTHCGILDKSLPLSDGVLGEIWKEGTGAKAQAFVPRGPVMRHLPRDGSPRGDCRVVRAGCLQGFGKGPGNPTLLKCFVQRGLWAA